MPRVTQEEIDGAIQAGAYGPDAVRTYRAAIVPKSEDPLVRRFLYELAGAVDDVTADGQRPDPRYVKALIQSISDKYRVDVPSRYADANTQGSQLASADTEVEVPAVPNAASNARTV